MNRPSAWLVEYQKSDFPVPEADLSGLTALVTGSNVGLGYETVAHLMRMKASRIIMAVRSADKGEQAKSDLLASRPDYSGRLDVWTLDMASFDSVKAFVQRCKQDLERLDIAILNAGIATQGWRVTKDGWEETLQVNDLSTGLLALLLLPEMQTPANNKFKPHLSIVSSGVHAWTQLPLRTAPNILEALNDKSLHDPADRYSISKLLDVFIAREIAALPAATSMVVTSSNPGLCLSELTREFPSEWKGAFQAISWTGEKGARNFAYAAIANDVSPGSYIDRCQATDPSEFVLSEDGQKTQKKIWQEMTNVWLKIAPEVAKVLS